LAGNSFNLVFDFYAQNELGESTGDGTYILTVNNVK
jgi:hypothetical protein